jgi:hypothetical protein
MNNIEAVGRIQNWSPLDPIGLFSFIEENWSHEEFVFKDKTINLKTNKIERFWFFRTGHIEDNEKLIAAIPPKIWGLCWVESRRGGYHRFIVES